MNICIVTVYNSENCGSYLQAYSLFTALSKMGHNVRLLERKPDISPPSNFILTKKIIRLLLKGQLHDSIYTLAMHLNFRNAQKRFPIIKENSIQEEKIDCFIIGSDTLWNIDVDHFLKRYKVYWGIDFSEKRTVTYAVSLSNTSFESLNKHSFVRPALNNLNYISVRDDYTKKIISEFTLKKIEKVCDPTLLMDEKDFDIIRGTCKYSKFVLLYIFEDAFLDKRLIQKLISYAQTNGLKIISFGIFRRWCDVSLPYDPYKFLSYIKNAENIITNTYHGTLLSIIHKKELAVLNTDKKKVLDVITLFELENRIIHKPDDIEKIFNDNINYANINERIIEQRQNGLSYLVHAMGD